jgi:transcriptional regulator with XRE-family HTH domain
METLRLFMFRHGIYQRELAGALEARGVNASEATVSRILRGSRRPQAGFRSAVVEALGELLGRPVTKAEAFGQEED